MALGPFLRMGTTSIVLGAPASSRPGGDEVPLKPRSVYAWAVPTSRLEAGASSAFRGRGRPVAPVPEDLLASVEPDEPSLLFARENKGKL